MTASVSKILNPETTNFAKGKSHPFNNLVHFFHQVEVKTASTMACFFLGYPIPNMWLR
uniref:Uncharacterized protein MANES_05G003800 n=1 Tax=Rhizophora mucronata TaxID=61149 RepID=A0A2P2JTU7_RHIMU